MNQDLKFWHSYPQCKDIGLYQNELQEFFGHIIIKIFLRKKALHEYKIAKINFQKKIKDNI